MATLTFDIKDEATATRIQNAFKGLFPISQVPVDAKKPLGETQNQYTDEQWVEVKTAEYVRNIVRRHENMIARQAITITVADDSVVSQKLAAAEILSK